ncbi:MAG TPA: cyclic pyranopterin monophosphate synthase MoaC, partial [Pyrinomonadaceae bacterium]|nr:cyclic pyranopterin monophosphate synthase MoaC [Pyrinomonadaceae bacterium]
MNKLSHFDAQGKIKMVDVSAKETTSRQAIASAKVLLNAETLETLKTQTNPKGNPLEIARIAGIMAAKKCSELIPLCHQINLSKADVRAELTNYGVYLEAEAKTNSNTGVEMEALTAVFGAGLSIFGICEDAAEDNGITEIQLELK